MIYLESVDNSSSEVLRPAACPPDPEALLNAQSSCAEIDRKESRGQAAGRRELNCQQPLAQLIKKMQQMNPFFVILGLILFLIQSASHANTLYPLDSPKQDAQFIHLLRELRCLVCQNQDLADSNAGLAKDLRDEVYKLVKDGRSDDEIVHYLTARYGDFILFKPPVKAVTALLWFGPAFFMLLGILIFWRTCLKRNNDE